MNFELKPCPFCGGEAQLIGHSPYSITCRKCRATTVICNTPDDAIKAWNNRVQPTFTLDEIDIIARYMRQDLEGNGALEKAILEKCNRILKGESDEKTEP